ncbi:MAG: YlmH/Sll1252 family protein [Clostridium sp.]
MLTKDDKVIKILTQRFSIEKDRAAHLLGKIKISKKTWDIIYTDFLTLNEQEFLKALAFDENMYIRFMFENGSERDIALISPYECDSDYPCTALSITGNFKFEKVGHGDYLGSILALGIKREKLGDLNVYENGAEVLVHNDVAMYIMFNLLKVKHARVKVNEIKFEDLKIKSLNLMEMSINVSSLRFDTIISGIYNISRTKSCELIKGSDAKINNIITTDPSVLVKQNDIITLRRYGKAKIGQVLRITKKERLMLCIYKYI